ncbi:EVE domain-containing protein [Leptolyngbya sp. AN03gr2]|uniref:EVE domain-containing protein n=1 Tax=unclassified Leptolyngbya TaxID=2650499 RepID=UPI003D310A6A
MQYWLMKSEPDVYSITDLERDRATVWDGIRNYQARNYLRSMKSGDVAFFYHSNANPPGIAGLMKIVESNIADPTQFDPDSKYYDAKSAPDSPRWQTVRVEFLQTIPFIPLNQLRENFTPEELTVVRPGNRLSVLPVATEMVDRILALSCQ